MNSYKVHHSIAQKCRAAISALAVNSIKYLTSLVFLGIVVWNLGCQTRSGETPAFSFIPGRTLIYHIKYTSDSSTNLGALFRANESPGAEKSPSAETSSNSYHTDIDGTLIATVLEERAEGTIVSYRLTDANLTVTGNGPIFVWTDRVKADLSKAMFVQVSQQGRMLSVRFDNEVNPASQTFGRTLLGIIQFVLPDSRGEDLSQWDSQEDDQAGQYTAHYALGDAAARSLADPAGILAFKKVKTKYAEEKQNRRFRTMAIKRLIEPGAGFSAEFNLRAGRLNALEGTEVEDVIQAGKKIAHTVDDVRLVYLKEETAAPAELSSLTRDYAERSTAAVQLSTKPPEELRERAIETNTLGDSTLASLLAELTAAEKSQGKSDTTQLYLKLKALFYLQPETCEPFQKLLTTAPATSVTLNLVTGALGAAGNQQAQQVLISVLRARSDDEAMFSKLSSILAETKSPTQEAEDVLSEFAFREPETNTAKTAQITIGTMAWNIGNSDPQRAQKIVQRLIEHLSASSDPQVLRRLLSAIGNAGSAEAIPTIKRLLNDTSPDLRGGAAYALRWIDSDEADELLAATITNDSETSVQLQAFSALSYRDMKAATFDAQKRVFLSERAENVRLAALKNLWEAREEYSEVVGVVKQAASADASEVIRKAASDMIASYQE
jgi:HEAT repeat protein